MLAPLSGDSESALMVNGGNLRVKNQIKGLLANSCETSSDVPVNENFILAQSVNSTAGTRIAMARKQIFKKTAEPESSECRAHAGSVRSTFFTTCIPKLLSSGVAQLCFCFVFISRRPARADVSHVEATLAACQRLQRASSTKEGFTLRSGQDKSGNFTRPSQQGAML